MSPIRHRIQPLPRPWALLVACAWVGFGFGPAIGQDALEFQELQNNLRTAYAKIRALEAGGGATTDVTALQKAAVTANAEAQELKGRYEQLRGLLEALDLGAIDGGGDEKTNRLIAALSDLRLKNDELKALSQALSQLIEASAQFSQVATPGNPESVQKLAAALQQAETVITTVSRSASSTSPKKELTAASVVSLKPELGVVVLDVGSRDGAKPGMPFNIFRGDKPIARVVVSEVRNSISGAFVLEQFSSTDNLMAGDRGEADVSQSF